MPGASMRSTPIWTEWSCMSSSAASNKQACGYSADNSHALLISYELVPHHHH